MILKNKIKETEKEIDRNKKNCSIMGLTPFERKEISELESNLKLLKEFEETIKRIKEELKRVRKIALKLHAELHSVNLDVKSWNNPVDGLDYSLHIIDEEVGSLR